MSTLHFASALLPSGWADDVQLVVTDGIITKVTTGTAPAARDERHPVAIPGIASLHSHAFQRGMAGLARKHRNAADTFWKRRATRDRFPLYMTTQDGEAPATMLYVPQPHQDHPPAREYP